MCKRQSNNELYAGITQDVFAEFDGSCQFSFDAGEIDSEVGVLPHHLICTTPTIIDAETDLTVHLWQDMARVVIYREWESDTALVAEIHYDLYFGDKLRELIKTVEERLRVIPDTRKAIESLMM